MLAECTVVVPTIGRPSLGVLLDALAAMPGPRPARSSWIAADLAYRRAALAAVGGFDERFPRAFREDSDLALRIMDTGGRLVRGRRWITHPVRPVDRWVSARVQAGNADDVLMRRLHGRGWRERADAPLGRRPGHLAVTAAA